MWILFYFILVSKKYEPTEVYMSGIDQSKADESMEEFLDKVEENIDYGKRYCGYYHTERQIDKLEFTVGRIKCLIRMNIILIAQGYR